MTIRFTSHQTSILPKWMFSQKTFNQISLAANGQCGIQVRPPNQQQRPSVFILLLWVHTTELLYCNSLLVYERGAAPHLVHGEHRGIFPHKQIQILGRLVHLDRENTGHLYHRVITSRGAKPIIFFNIGNLLLTFFGSQQCTCAYIHKVVCGDGVELFL